MKRLTLEDFTHDPMYLDSEVIEEMWCKFKETITELLDYYDFTPLSVDDFMYMGETAIDNPNSDAPTMGFGYKHSDYRRYIVLNREGEIIYCDEETFYPKAVLDEFDLSTK